MDVIAVLSRPAFDRSESGRPFTQGFDFLAYIVVGDVHGRHFEIKVFIVRQIKFGKNLEDCPELEGLAFGEVELFDLRLRDGREFLLADGLFHALRHERLHDFTLDVVGEAPANQRDWRLARTEARDTGDARKFLCDALQFFGDFIRGNLEIELAAAGCCSTCISHGNPFDAASLQALKKKCRAGKARWSRPYAPLSAIQRT